MRSTTSAGLIVRGEQSQRAILTRYREQAGAPRWRGAATNHGSPRSTRALDRGKGAFSRRRQLVADGVLVGRVAAVFRYPVKSMAAEPVEDVDVSWHGLSGDRRWAFVRPDLSRSGFPWLTLRQRNDLNDYHPLLDGAGTPGRVRGHRPYTRRRSVRCHCAGARGRDRCRGAGDEAGSRNVRQHAAVADHHEHRRRPRRPAGHRSELSPPTGRHA